MLSIKLPRARLQWSLMVVLLTNVSILCSFDGVTERKQNPAYDEAIFALSIVIAVLSPIAVTGNVLIVAVIWINRSLRTPFYMFLCGLALTDLFTGLITQPFYVASQFICSVGPQEIEGRQRFLVLARVITGGFGAYLIYMTVLILTCMSIERWLQMSRRFLFIQRRENFIVAGIILAPIPFSVFRTLNNLTVSYEHVLTVSLAFFIALYHCHIDIVF